MKFSPSRSARKLGPLLTVLVLWLATLGQTAHAALINISLSNTSQLPAGTGFFLQYSSLNGVANGNSVTASNFQGLTPAGPPDPPVGTASGSLSGNPSNPSVGDAGNAAFNEFFQTFNASANTLSFDFNTAVNNVSGGPFDSFSFQLLRQDGNAYTTNATDGQTTVRATSPPTMLRSPADKSRPLSRQRLFPNPRPMP